MSTEDSRRAAIGLIRRGVAPIPVPVGEKNPNRRGWQDERIPEEDVPRHWANGQNVGVLCGEPSGWLVDVDLDSQEATVVAGRFLSPTLTSGRESRPSTHWWYRCVGAESRDWKDTDGGKLVELRSTGRQTLVAPSVHPSGERYLWHRESGLKATKILPGELAHALNLLATAALIARHLPPIKNNATGEGGGRHDYSLALCGFLLRPGRFDQAVVEKVLKTAWDAKGWSDEGKRREAHRAIEGNVRDTAVRIEDGEQVVGGPTLEEIAPGMVGLLCKWWGWKNREQDPAEEKEERRNQTDRLIAYALADIEGLFVDQYGAPHALVDGQPTPLSTRCYSWLRRLLWQQEGRAVGGESLKTAAGTLAAQAEFSGNVRELHVRVAWHEGALYYELAPGRVIEVGAGGWRTAERSPALFRRFANLKPLPDPTHGGAAESITKYVNLKTDRDKRLFTAYAATLPLPHVGRPIFNTSGAMGSGKTTMSRLLKRLFDPTAPEAIRLDPRDFLQKASHAYVVMLDNQNTMPEWAADTLCRLVTGEADSKRKLYSDDEDVIIELKRAVLLNGINVPTDRGDVLDRSLVVELERIPDAKRRTEEEMWERFRGEHPELLGAILDVLAQAIALKPSLKLSRRPRLADWGEYAAAVYEVMGWGAETFLRDWDEVVKVQNQATLDGSPVAQAIIKFVEERGEYLGASSELHGKLKPVAAAIGVDVERDKAWPKSARWLWRRIKEVLPLLVAAGIEAHRTEDKSGSKITLSKMPKDDATDAAEVENGTDKPEAGGITLGPDAAANAAPGGPDAIGGNNADSDATGKAPNHRNSVDGGISGMRYEDSSGALSKDQERRIRKLVQEGMTEEWARREVLAADHPLDCDCEVCV